MDLDFTNATLLGFSQNNINFESDLTFSVEKTISVSGLLLDLSNSEGVASITQATEDFLKSTKDDLKQVTINSVDYGKGYVESFNVDGDQIKTAEYSITLKVFEEKSLTDLILSGGGTEINETTNSSFSAQGITDSDLKSLANLSEELDFSNESDGGIKMTHNFSCSFRERESLISLDNADWTDATVSTSKSRYLGNRGKGSILIAPNTVAYIEPTGLIVGTEYVLEFEYLGKNTNSANWGDANILFVGSTASKTLTSRGFYKLEFTPDSISSFRVMLLGGTSYSAYFDNVKLYKKVDKPLEKSRALSEVFFQSSPIYGIVESDHKGEYENVNIFDNVQSDESFDSINLQYSKSKSIGYHTKTNGASFSSFATPTPGAAEKYSLLVNSSLEYNQGIVSIEESSDIKLIKTNTEIELKTAIDQVLHGAYGRCLEKYNKYKDSFSYNCPTLTKTEVTGELFGSNVTPTPFTPTVDQLAPFTGIRAVRTSKVIDVRFGKASISTTFSNDPRFVDSSYSHQVSFSISYEKGYYFIEQSGEISGDGNSPSERNSKAKEGWLQDIEPSINNKTEINKIKQNIASASSDTFNISGKQLSSNESAGSISYSASFSNSPSSELVEGGVVKFYDIQTTETDNIRLSNEFLISCQSSVQFLGVLYEPKMKTVTIDVSGFRGQSMESLYNAAYGILESKSLLFGLGSETFPPTPTPEPFQYGGLDVNEFLTENSISYEYQGSRLTYTRSVIDFSSCPNELNPITPTPFEKTFTAYTPTKTAFTLTRYDGPKLTPTPKTATPIGYSFYETPTVAVTPTLTIQTPTPTFTREETLIPNGGSLNIDCEESINIVLNKSLNNAWTLVLNGFSVAVKYEYNGELSVIDTNFSPLSYYVGEFFNLSGNDCPFSFYNYYSDSTRFAISVESQPRTPTKTPGTPTVSPTPTLQPTLVKVEIPANWNKTASLLCPEGTIAYGLKCHDYRSNENSDLPFYQFSLNQSWANNTIVKDCRRIGTGEPWYELYFNVSGGTPYTPTPWIPNDGCTPNSSEVELDVPEWWIGKASDICKDGTLFGVEACPNYGLSSGDNFFIYTNIGSDGTDSRFPAGAFNGDTTIVSCNEFYGPPSTPTGDKGHPYQYNKAWFDICVPYTPTKTYSIVTVDVPASNSLPIKDLYPQGTAVGGLNCSGLKVWFDDISDPDKPVSLCTELSSGDLKYDKIYFRVM
jgi:hypothetical protein